MPSPDFGLSAIRLVLLVAPAIVAARCLRRRYSTQAGPFAVLAECVLAVSWLIVVGEGLGVLGELRFWRLVLVSWIAAGILVVALRIRARPTETGPTGDVVMRGATGGRFGPMTAAVAMWVAVTQWLFTTVNVLGSGMESFDTLWYHMPIAATFAQSGSITGILFPEADPSNAYFPADSELLHGLGIIAVGNDFLSPFLNLAWMALALLASWCLGTRWRVQWWTLSSCAVVFALPVLSTTQPGQALDDIVGLAALAAALALMVAPRRGWLEIGITALALGVAVGTKWTFLVPASALGVGAIWLERDRGRVRVSLAMLGGAFLTGGWWYLRDLIHTGSPLGLRQTIGPIQLPGAASPLSTSSNESVFTAAGHSSLWTSRFAPGLNHALGPLWPVVLAVVAGAVLLTLAHARRDRHLLVLAMAAALAAAAYPFYPATAQNVTATASFFSYDLRFLAPALVLAFLLIPAILSTSAPRLLPLLGSVLVATALAAQFEHGVWPTQPERHIAFLALTLLVGLGVLVGARHPPRIRPWIRALGAVAALIAALVTGGLTEHHYVHRRYLVDDSAIGQIYRWAQTVSHVRIALYGTVEQYPLYGARDTNLVTYLGERTAHGGYQPITKCARWQRSVRAGNYQYVVLTPGPTGEIPTAWAQTDSQLRSILHPAPPDWVFAVDVRQPLGGCS